MAPVFFVFCKHRTLIFYNMYNAKCSFLPPKYLHLGIKNPSQNQIFSRRLPGHPFCDFRLILQENCRFGKPFKIRWALGWDPKSTKWRQNPSSFSFMGVPLFGPDFWMHFGRSLAHFRCPFSTPLVLIGSLLLHFARSLVLYVNTVK